MPGSHFAEKLMGEGSAQAEDHLTLLRKCATARLQLCATIPTPQFFQPWKGSTVPVSINGFLCDESCQNRWPCVTRDLATQG